MALEELTRNNLSASIEIANYKARIENARDGAQAAFEDCLREDRELQAKIARTASDRNIEALDKSWHCLQERIKYYAGMVAGYNAALMLLYA